MKLRTTKKEIAPHFINRNILRSPTKKKLSDLAGSWMMSDEEADRIFKRIRMKSKLKNHL